MENSPCHKCKTRAVGCHGKCTEFADWKNRQFAILENIKQERLRTAPSMRSMKTHREWVKNHGHS